GVERLEDGGGAAGIELERLGPGEIGGGPHHGGDLGPVGVGSCRPGAGGDRPGQVDAERHQQRPAHMGRRKHAKAVRPKLGQWRLPNGVCYETGRRGRRWAAPHGSRRPFYWNTAAGSSRLSEPSNAIWSRPSAATTRSSERVWSVSPSMTACTTA